MTRDEAIAAFHEALLTAVNGSQQVQSAIRRMQSILRSLRIDPDLQFQAGAGGSTS